MFDSRIKVQFVAAIHPNMPGDDLGVYRKVIAQIKPLEDKLEFDLAAVKDPVKSEGDGERAKVFLDISHVYFTLI